MVTFIAMVAYFAYKLYQLTTKHPNTYLMLQKAYNFIVFQKIVMLDNESHNFIDDKNEIDLTRGG